MLINDVLTDVSYASIIRKISSECGEFISESGGLPVYRLMHGDRPTASKVKVRLTKRGDVASAIFNEAFNHLYDKISQRAVFASGHVINDGQLAENMHQYYVFFPDQYKYMYSSEITNSSIEHQSIIERLVSTLDRTDEALQLASEILQFSYKSDNLVNGIHSGNEVIFYNVPYFYAVEKSRDVSYDSILDAISRGA